MAIGSLELRDHRAFWDGNQVALTADEFYIVRFLARQPGIFMTTPKEPCFFSDDDVYARGLDWYRGLFAAAPTDAVCGESSTHYTKRPTHPHSAERIARDLGPDVRFVYLMRHPIDRLVSHCEPCTESKSAA